MTSQRIADIFSGRASVGDHVEIQGWVRTRRDSKAGISFVNVHDGSCHDALQVVAPAELGNYEDEVKKLSAGCSVICRGELVASQGKGQSVEMKATEIVVVGWVENPDTYPMQPKRHTREFLREVAHLRPRTNLVGSIARVRNSLSQAIHRYFHERGYLWVHTPIITGSDTEGAGEMFRVSTLDMENLPRTDKGEVDYSKDFFGKQTSLTVSGQLNVETYCVALSKVYTFGPTFRAENSNTKRHLAEFWMVEPELAFADLDDIAALTEDFLKYIFKAVLEERPDDMAFFNKFVQKGLIERLEAFIEAPFARMSYTEAVEILQSCGKNFEFPVEWGMDLQSEHERYLCEEHVGRPVIVTDYPRDIKAFYMRQNSDGKTVAALDVLAPGIGEIIGGSQREERLDVLTARIEEMGLDPEDYDWYLDLRRYGSVPHGGFGLGFDRAVSYITGVENIRDVIPFPRTVRNAPF